MEKDEYKEEEILINIHWYGCEGTKLSEKEIEDLEDFFDAVLNDEAYFEDSDAWVMELMLFEVLFKMN